MTYKADNHKDEPASFPVVALCASAGGLEAFQAFFEAMPAGSGMAFVVMQHQLPQKESMLHSILQRHTSMPVRLIAGESPLRPDHVYVTHANNEISIKDGHFQLSEKISDSGWPKVIDRFLESLAHDRGHHTVAVILSGLGTDGTEGARIVKENGGLVIAQEPSSATQAFMPNSVIEAKLADVILPAAEMPDYLVAKFDIVVQPSTAAPELQKIISEEDLQKIVRRLRRQTGRDFEDYKISTMQRQVTRRMATLQLDTIDGYLDYLHKNPEEGDHLIRYLMISVTNFFRDPEAFESLKTNALLPVLRKMDIDTILRVWVPGCASGEEAVSLAIVIYECLRELDMPEMEVRIFASDANRELIQRARSGHYPHSIAENVTESRLRDHFFEENGGYHVRNHISRMIIWSEHNLVEHPPFSQLHLISCRNVLIYFQRQLQDRVLSLFQFALRPKGILFLGSSETLPFENDDFTTIDSKYKIYARNANLSRAWLQLDQPLFKSPLDYLEKPMSTQKPSKQGDGDHKLQVVKDMLVEHYSPTSVIIDENYQIRYSFGEIDRYLRLVPGDTVQRNILEMAREGLDVDLTIALHDAFSDNDTTIRRPGVWVRTNGDERIINLVVKPIRDGQLGNRLKLVIFELALEGRDLRNNEDIAATSDEAQDPTAIRVRQELQQTREVLQSTTQALQAKSEELTTSLEEIRSANEEVQTTNEELRTSKEELESMNEELNTLNTQLIDQNDELTNANNTLYNFMQATEIAMIFLDQTLNIREFTPATIGLFNLRAEDKGRPLHEITNNLYYTDLLNDAESVLNTLRNMEQEVQVTTGEWYSVRIRPYRTTNNMIDGVVLTFTDISVQKDVQAALEQSEERFRSLAELSPYAIFVNLDGRFVYANPTAALLLGTPDTNKIIGRSPFEFLEPEYHDLVREQTEQVLDGEAVARIEYRWKRVDGSPVEVEVAASLINWQGAPAIQVVVRDIGERKIEQRQQTLLRYRNQLINTIENSLLELDKDLRIIGANESFYETFQVTEDGTVGQLLYDLGNGQWDIPDLRRLLNEIIPQQSVVHNYEVTHNFPDLGKRTMRLNARQIAELDRLLLVITDISGE